MGNELLELHAQEQSERVAAGLLQLDASSDELIDALHGMLLEANPVKTATLTI